MHGSAEVTAGARHWKHLSRWIAIGIVSGALGCNTCTRRAQESPRDDACRAACAALVTKGCDRDGLQESDQTRCVERCVDDGAKHARAECESQRLDYLGCVSTADFDCKVADCSAGTCISTGAGLRACQALHTTWRQCLEPCLHVGVVKTGSKNEPQIDYEYVRAGCAECPQNLERGAPPGSPCEVGKVCDQVCCSCEQGPGRYLARVCIEGACASRPAACAAAASPCGRSSP